MRSRYLASALASSVLPTPGGPLDEHGLAEPRGEEGDERRRLARQVAGGAQAGVDVVDGSGSVHLRQRIVSWRCSPPSRPSPAPFIALMVLGFVIGVAGHIYKSRPVIATGIGLIFIATLLLPLAVNATD